MDAGKRSGVRAQSHIGHGGRVRVNRATDDECVNLHSRALSQTHHLEASGFPAQAIRKAAGNPANLMWSTHYVVIFRPWTKEMPSQGRAGRPGWPGIARSSAWWAGPVVVIMALGRRCLWGRRDGRKQPVLWPVVTWSFSVRVMEAVDKPLFESGLLGVPASGERDDDGVEHGGGRHI